MPAPAKRPSPDVRMVQLLIFEKRAVLQTHGQVTEDDFARAWETCWAIMVTERAWPHATAHRRAWRKAMVEALMPEARACFLGHPTGFQKYIVALADAMDKSVEADSDRVVGVLVA